MFKILMAYLLLVLSIPLSSSETSRFTEKLNTDFEDTENPFQFYSQMSEQEKEMNNAFLALDWKTAGVYKLPKSNSTLFIPEGCQLLIGADANEARRLTCGDIENPDLEAAIYDANFEHIILFENFKTGHVFLDDWKDIDSENLLKSISENTEKANKRRGENNQEEIHVLGWVQKPTLNKRTHTIYWAFEAETTDAESSFNIINSVALKLGREGFEKITWAVQKESYVLLDGHLDNILSSYNFDPGYQYQDYQIGDEIANYKIGALVAATAGGSLVKAGGLVVFLKKLGGFAFAALIAFFYKIKNIFKSRKQVVNAV